MQIYIHIPFCLRKCRYCAFNSIVANSNLINEYVDALCLEIERTNIVEPIKTIYFGGGTPTILTTEQFSKVFNTLNSKFNLEHCTEITVEANPGTVDLKYLETLRRLGVNRLSLGVQSFDDDLLKILGRIHSSQEAIEIIHSAKSIFDNVSIDLMYDLPNQTYDILKDTLEMAMNLEVQHISIYGLEVEEETEFGKLYNLNKLLLPSDEESGKMYDLITNELPKQGWHRYEISNYAKKGYESQHNLGYWSDINYIGFGAGAHSYFSIRNVELGIRNLRYSINKSDFGIRYSNIKNIKKYIDDVKNNKEIQILEEVLNRQAAIEEFCFLSLRKAEGIDILKFQNKFNIKIGSIYDKIIKKLLEKHLIEMNNQRIYLTKLGMKYGNQVFCEFLLS